MSDPEFGQCCGAHRFTREPSPLEADTSIFSFAPYDPLAGPPRAVPPRA